MCGFAESIQAIIAFGASIWSDLADWAFAPSKCDITVWAIAFTINTWALSLGRAKFQLHGAIRKAIDESRTQVQQAHLVEQLRNYPVHNLKDAREFLEDCNNFLTKLAKWEIQYPKLDRDEPISGPPRVVLSVCTLFSALCIVLKWLYNITLVVLLPYPILLIYYNWQRYRLPRYITQKRTELISKIPDVLRRLGEAQEKAQKQFDETTAIMQEVQKKLGLSGDTEPRDTVAPLTPDKESSSEKD